MNKQNETLQAQQRLQWLIDKDYLIAINTNTYQATVEPYTVGSHLQSLGYDLDLFDDRENEKLVIMQEKNVTPAELDEAYDTATRNRNHTRPTVAYLNGIISKNRQRSKQPEKKTTNQTKVDKPKKLSANRQHQINPTDIEDTPQAEAIGKRLHRQRLIDSGVPEHLIP